MAEEPLSTPITSRVVVIEAQPIPLRIDTTQAAILVIDMQNDFGTKGGMFDRAGIDISMIQRAVGPTARVLTAARQAGIPVVYLKQLNVKYLLVTGCTTSICVESTIRDAMFRDYSCLLFADCTGKPLGEDFQRSNHEASLFVIQALLGWVSNSEEFLKALAAPVAAGVAHS